METGLTMNFSFSSGALLVTGPAIQQLGEDAITFRTNYSANPIDASISDVTPYQVVVLSRVETERLTPEDRIRILAELSHECTILPIQLRTVTGNTSADDSTPTISFLCLYWPEASLLRARLGLPPLHFHILLCPDTNELQVTPELPNLVSLNAPIMKLLGAAHSHMKKGFMSKPLLSKLASSKQARRSIARQVAQEVLALTELIRTSLDKETCLVQTEPQSGISGLNSISSKVALERVIALRWIGDMPNELLKEAKLLVQIAPKSPVAHVQLAHVQFILKMYADSVLSAWYALLIITISDADLHRKAISVLAKCQEHLNHVRLDVRLQCKHKGKRECDNCIQTTAQDPSERWEALDAMQRAAHTKLLGDVAIQFEREQHFLKGPPVDPRRSRFSVLCSTSSGDVSNVLLPWFFSWVVPFRLAASKEPDSVSDIDTLAIVGINRVVTLTMERSLPPHWFNERVRNVYLPVRDFHAPSFAQLDAYFAEVTAPGAVSLVHCRAGKGRTGVFLAAWFMLFGEHYTRRLCVSCTLTLHENNRARLRVGGCIHDSSCSLSPWEPVMTAEEAVRAVRNLRPMSVHTERQHSFLREYYSELWRRSTGIAQEIDVTVEKEDTGTPLTVLGRKPTALPQLLVLMGLPGAGKSHLAARIADELGSTAVIASQDELRSRAACEAVVAKGARMHAGGANCVVVDRCNLLHQDRTHWLDVAFRPDNAVVIDVATDPDTCKRRATARVDHPTMAPDHAARVIDGVKRSVERAGNAEIAAGFECVLIVNGTDAADEVIGMFRRFAAQHSTRLSKPVREAVVTSDARRLPGIFKFPRTRHLVDLGSCTSDDLRMSREDARQLLRLARTNYWHMTVEEKVDGANIGFSVTEDGEIQVQNRSHYVNSSSHVQFRLLNRFVAGYEADIRAVCEGRRVLFGEWMYARHSVRYTRLPSYFLAFDVYDTSAGKFLSRRAFDELLDRTSLQRVHRFDLGHVWGLEELESALLEQRSMYTDDAMEGVYLRADRGDWLVERCKLVRKGFICGNEHWSARRVELNGMSNPDELWAEPYLRRI